MLFTDKHPVFSNLTQAGKQQVQKEWLKLERSRVKTWAKAHLQGKAFKNQNNDIHVNGKGISEIVNQPHESY